MAADVAGGRHRCPSLPFHLGDVVYNFGEAEYYYDQFYEPFRAYDRPIFAIPGNHDGLLRPQYGVRADARAAAFIANFCAPTPGRPGAGGLARTTMTQPGVYFTLDAPFVSIIGLYTNVLEGPGVISTQGGAYPAHERRPVDALVSELKRLAPRRRVARRAVILACHHPPAPPTHPRRDHRTRRRPRQGLRQRGFGRMPCSPGTRTSTSASPAA